MDKQEKIVCAAVKVARVKSDYKGVKIVTGVDYQSIYNDGVLSYLANDQDTNIWQNGFITDKNRFVDSVEAQQIAIACGQYRDPNARIKVLETIIENDWHQVNIAKSSQMIRILKNQIARNQAEVNELKAGYLGNALRVEDLHYV